MILLLALLAVVLTAAGCGGNDKPDAPRSPTPTATAATAATASSLVALGDSIALAGPECDGCRSFVDLYGDALAKATGGPVKVINDAVPNANTADVLDHVKSDADTRDALKAADVAVVQVGFNDTPWNRGDDPCHAAPQYPVVAWKKITPACTARVTNQFSASLEDLLGEIDAVRGGAALKLYVTTAYNAVLGDKVDESWDSPAAVAPSIAANRAFARAQCRRAAAHEGTCIQVGRAFNAPNGSQRADRFLAGDHTHPNPRGHELIAQLLRTAG